MVYFKVLSVIRLEGLMYCITKINPCNETPLRTECSLNNGIRRECYINLSACSKRKIILITLTFFLRKHISNGEVCIGTHHHILSLKR
jgi:hypothetical protein